MAHEFRNSQSYSGRPDCDIAAFYGLSEGLRKVFDDYRKNRTVLFVDLGYWGRRKKTRWDGYHKVVINARHPTAYFQQKPQTSERFLKFGIDIKPWRKSGGHIIVAGMSGKAAVADGLNPEQWERQTIMKLRKLTKRPIVYRPKPKWVGARHIIGSTLDCQTPLEQALVGCHAVVTHHSNVAVDALMAGIPCICFDGVASAMSSHSLSDIENPLMPDGREQWAYDLAHTQWTFQEMADGTMWQHFRNEGVL